MNLATTAKIMSAFVIWAGTLAVINKYIYLVNFSPGPFSKNRSTAKQGEKMLLLVTNIVTTNSVVDVLRLNRVRYHRFTYFLSTWCFGLEGKLIGKLINMASNTPYG